MTAITRMSGSAIKNRDNDEESSIEDPLQICKYSENFGWQSGVFYGLKSKLSLPLHILWIKMLFLRIVHLRLAAFLTVKHTHTLSLDIIEPFAVNFKSIHQKYFFTFCRTFLFCFNTQTFLHWLISLWLFPLSSQLVKFQQKLIFKKWILARACRSLKQRNGTE